MTTSTQRSADGPSVPAEGPSSFQPELPTFSAVLDGLFQLHDAGATWTQVVVAWTWLEAQARDAARRAQ